MSVGIAHIDDVGNLGAEAPLTTLRQSGNACCGEGNGDRLVEQLRWRSAERRSREQHKRQGGHQANRFHGSTPAMSSILARNSPASKIGARPFRIPDMPAI